MTSLVAEDVRSSDVGARTKSKATLPRLQAVSMERHIAHKDFAVWLLTSEGSGIRPGPTIRSRNRADAAELRRNISPEASVGVVLVVVHSGLIKNQIGVSCELDRGLPIGKRNHAIIGGADGSLSA